MNAPRPWTLHVGDNRDVLADVDADSIDACVTDTPYGLSTALDPPRLSQEAAWRKIMNGRETAAAKPLQAFVDEALAAHPSVVAGGSPSVDEYRRILADAMETRACLGSPFDRLLCTWLDTGENPRLRGKGFMGNEWDVLVPPPNAWRATHRVLKPGAYLFAFGGARTHGLIDASIRLADFEVDDEFCVWLYGQGMPKRVRLDLKIDQHFGKAGERPVIGASPFTSRRPNGVQGYGMNMPLAPETTAATPEAVRFVGWDRARRPAFEPIIVAAKPLAGTIAENALKYGTGGLHVDACRIERGDAGPLRWDHTRGMGYGPDGKPQGNDHGSCGYTNDPRGGFPSNVILDEAAAEALDASVGHLPGRGNRSPSVNKVTGYNGGWGSKDSGVAATLDSGGGPSRFFYVAKAATSERDKGLEAMPVLTPGERSGREDGSAGINGYAGTRGEARNVHPCVKPISLMRWLVRLASPPGAWDQDPAARPVVLDPFTGSGSTGVACMVEGVRFVGAEMSPEYAAIARARLQHAYALPPEETAKVGDGDADAVDWGMEAIRKVASGQGSLF